MEIRLGLASERGQRPQNEDFAACWRAEQRNRSLHGVIAAIADGVGGARGGRVAAETAVRGFIDGMLGQSEAVDVRSSGGVAIAAVNSWIHAIGRADPELAGMACTLTGLVLRGRRLHVLHVGDTRLYRFREDQLEQLTTDHTPGRPGVSHSLTRAVGALDTVRVDYAEHLARAHDRMLLVSDGVHGAVSDARIAAELGRRAAPEEAARRLVQAALDGRIGDNATALVLDIVDLPPPDQADIESSVAARPIRPPPRAGTTLDGYLLEVVLSDSRYSRVFRGRDLEDGKAVVLKFPKPGVAEEATFRQAFVRESWIAARVRSPFVGEVLEASAGRATQLYSVLPLYGGETLELRLRRPPPVRLEEGVTIATRLGKAVAALHRAGVVHRDIKPDNVILMPEGLKLIDLGVARLPHLEEFAASDVPGTPSYMAPELLAGRPGDESSDLFALGVTLWRMWGGGAYPYGEIEPFSRPHFGRPASLLQRRPDLPSWLDQALSRAIAVDRRDRQGDVLELVLELETGMARGAPVPPRRLSLYERNPTRFWQLVSALLFAGLLASWALGLR
jgi:serine/threonine protein phosphatase PrpC